MWTLPISVPCRPGASCVLDYAGPVGMRCLTTWVVVFIRVELLSPYASTLIRWGRDDAMQQDITSPIVPRHQPWMPSADSGVNASFPHHDVRCCTIHHLQITDIRPLDLSMNPINTPGGCMAILHANKSGRYSATLIRSHDSSFIKRSLDIVASLTMLLMLLPLMLMITIAVRIDSGGPILFRQRRVGRYGQEFEMLKFRTMITEWQRLRVGPLFVPDSHRRVHKSPQDARVTRVGGLLRRTSLDELPQLWNVLVGDMSLVGPRPELPEIVASYEPWQHARHLVRPGITGWWQINRDGMRLMHETTELDLYYVLHKSLRLDLEILVRTVPTVIRGTGAF